MCETRAGYGIALLAFIVAALTDFLDGYLARRLNLVTSLGKLLDPIADKILTACAFIFLCAHEQRFCPVWVVVVILAREFLVTGLRQIAVEKGKVIAAGSGSRDETGKVQPLDVKAGDMVLFGKWSGTEVKIDGQEYLIMKESDIMGVIE